MGSGGTEIVINPGERAISDDQNRAQKFREADLNELLRALVDTFCGAEDANASSLDIQSTTQGAPLSATVFNGLVVRPQVGTLNLLVDGGVVGVYDPDSVPNPDDSQFKVIRDPGVTSATPLVITANTSGQTRIDVIECARNLDPYETVLETDSRDVFNPVTGLFAPAVVNKVVTQRLRYRVRAGTSGAGMPTNVAGWLPLCVASVPTGLTIVDQCTFWDVRPFAGDRILPPFNVGSQQPRNRRNMLYVDSTTTGGQALLGGYVETSAVDTLAPVGASAKLGVYRLGGVWNPTEDLDTTAFQSGTLADGPVYIYLCEPFGLPRWARYTLQSGALIPQHRGLTVISSTSPIGFLNSPGSALALPVPTGLGGTTSKAVCVGATRVAGGLVFSMATDGVTQSTSALPFAAVAGTIVGGGDPHVNFTLTRGTHFPAHASAVWVTVEIVITVPASTTGFVTEGFLYVTNAAFSAAALQMNPGPQIYNNANSGGAASFIYACRIKVPTAGNVSSDLHLQFVSGLTGSGVALASGAAQIDQWDVA